MRARLTLLGLAFAAAACSTTDVAKEEDRLLVPPEPTRSVPERTGETRSYQPDSLVVTSPDRLHDVEKGKADLAKVDEIVGGPSSDSCTAAIPEVMAGFPLMPPGVKSGNGEQAGFAQLKSPAPSPRLVPDPVLELTLAGPTSRAPGDPLALTLSMKNRSKDEVVVMRALDGSIDHWRSPYYDVYVEETSTGRQFRYDRQGGRCGNVNTIAADDYVDLAPGASADKLETNFGYHLGMSSIGKPGTYQVWVVYQFCGFASTGEPLGKDLVRQETHRGVHVSNAITVTVK